MRKTSGGVMWEFTLITLGGRMYMSHFTNQYMTNQFCNQHTRGSK